MHDHLKDPDGVAWSAVDGWHRHQKHWPYEAIAHVPTPPSRPAAMVTSGANMLRDEELAEVVKVIIDTLGIDAHTKRIPLVKLVRKLAGVGLREADEAVRQAAPCATCGTKRGEVRR
jgi:ribosomal protein L7/L12